MTRIPPRRFDGLWGRELLKAIYSYCVPGGDDGECWDWAGGFTRDEHGRKAYPVLSRQVGAHRRTQGVHRVSLEAAFGPMLPGEQAHHRCGRHVCVRPEHLEPASQSSNAAEMLSRKALLKRIAYLESVVRETIGTRDNHVMRTEP